LERKSEGKRHFKHLEGANWYYKAVRMGEDGKKKASAESLGTTQQKRELIYDRRTKNSQKIKATSADFQRTLKMKADDEGC